MDVQQKKLFPKNFKVTRNYDSLIPDEDNLKSNSRTQNMVDVINKIARRSQAQHVFNSLEGVVNLQEYRFLREYGTRNSFGTMTTENLLKCVGYVKNKDQRIHSDLERELIECIGDEKVKKINSSMKRIRY